MHVMLRSRPCLFGCGTAPARALIKAADLTRTGIGLPAYYNDEVIIPSLVSRRLSIEDARDYNIIGCVEPQKAGKTEGWHDAAFFNMCRPLELVFSGGVDLGRQIGPQTGEVTRFKTFDEFYDAYKTQMNYMIELLVNAINAIDVAHAERCPLPFLSSMVEDCIARGKSVQEGGAVYNFTGPQGFGIANITDALWAIKTLVFDQKKYSLADFKDALEQFRQRPAETQSRAYQNHSRRADKQRQTSWTSSLSPASIKRWWSINPTPNARRCTTRC